MQTPDKTHHITFSKVMRLSSGSAAIKKARRIRRQVQYYSDSNGLSKKRMLSMAVIVLTVVIVGFTIAATTSDTVNHSFYETSSSEYNGFAGRAELVISGRQTDHANSETTGVVTESSVLAINHPIDIGANHLIYDKGNAYAPEARYRFVSDITLGSQNDFVLAMQQRLSSLDFLLAEHVSSYFCNDTLSALHRFQRQHGYQQHDYASAEVLNTLFSEQAQLVADSVGDECWTISAMQARLVLLGYEVSITGIFDDATYTAVSHFQSLNGLAVTGRISRFDEDMLFSATPVFADGERRALSEYRALADFSVAMLLDTAFLHLGVRYTWAGKSPATGFDCSGFVYYTLNRSGLSIAYMTDIGWRNFTDMYVVRSIDQLQAGDVLIFVGHVGLYIGNGTMIDSSFSIGRVRITCIEQSFWRAHWVSGRRPV